MEELCKPPHKHHDSFPSMTTILSISKSQRQGTDRTERDPARARRRARSSAAKCGLQSISIERKPIKLKGKMRLWRCKMRCCEMCRKWGCYEVGVVGVLK